MGLRLITPPAVEPVELTIAREHLVIEGAEHDALLQRLIATAREQAQEYQGRAYITQSYELTLDAWPGNVLELPRPPLRSVESITYLDETGAEVTIPPTDYVVDTKAEPGRIIPAPGQSWPAAKLWPASPISIRFTAGYGDASADVPETVKQALLVCVAAWFENREAGDMPRTAEDLLRPNRMQWGV